MGCCAITGPYRFALLPINGTERAPEHFAIDFARLDAQGRLYVGVELHSWSRRRCRKAPMRPRSSSLT
jgi:hypothetical protein